MQPVQIPRKHEQRIIDLQQPEARTANLAAMKTEIREFKDTLSQLSNKSCHGNSPAN